MQDGRGAQKMTGVSGARGGVVRTLYAFVQNLEFIKTIIMIARLWREVRFLALVLIGCVFVILYIGGVSARGVYGFLQSLKAPGSAPAIAATLSGLIVIEFSSRALRVVMIVLLRLAYDTGREAVASCLWLLVAAAIAGAVADFAFPSGYALTIFGIPAIPFAAAGLLAILIWFSLVYQRPAFPGFRAFWDDVVNARFFLKRQAYDD